MENQLQTYLHKHIPISQAMGVQVKLAHSQQVILSAPFANNINHKKTVFGGSLQAIATLACWSLLHVNLLETNDLQIVITRSEIDYLLPVTGDFTAECSLSDSLSWERFLKTLQARRKARIQLLATIKEGNRLCVNYKGIFAAILVSKLGE